MTTERTVPETVEEYLTHLRARVNRGTYSATCLEDMERVLRKFAKQFAIPVSQCRRGDLMYFLDANPGYSSIHTKKRVCTSIVSCFRWALEEELIEKCPYRRPKELMRGAYPARRPMKLNEFRAVLRKSNPSFRRALIGLFRTGMRTCEIHKLTWANVYLDESRPYLETSAKLRHRRVVLDAVMCKLLLFLLRHRKPDQEHVFLNFDGNPWRNRTFSYRFRKTAQRAGVPPEVCAYTIRHMYACDGIKSGLSNKAVADLLGHADTSMVDRVYAASTRDDIEHLATSSDRIIDDRAKRPAEKKPHGPCPIKSDPRNAVPIAILIDAYLPYVDELVKNGTLGLASAANVQRVLAVFREKCGTLTAGEFSRRELFNFIRAEPSWSSVWTQKTARNVVIRVFFLAHARALIASHHFMRKDNP